MSNKAKVVAVAVVVVALALLIAEPSFADPHTTTTQAGDTTKIGANLGREVASWGKALLLAVVALVGIPALAKRDFAQAMVIAGIAVVIGGFVFATPAVEAIIRAIWTTVGG